MFSFDPLVYSIDLDSIALCIQLGGSGCGAGGYMHIQQLWTPVHCVFSLVSALDSIAWCIQFGRRLCILSVLS